MTFAPGDLRLPTPFRHGSAVLQLEVRRRIMDLVHQSPGLHLRALSGVLGVPPSTLAYHCRILGREGFVEAHGSPHLKALYPSQGMDRRDKAILFALQHPVRRSVCSHLLQGARTPGELKRFLGVSGPALSFHLQKLRAARIIAEEPDGRTKWLRLEDRERVASLLATHGEGQPQPQPWPGDSPQPQAA